MRRAYALAGRSITVVLAAGWLILGGFPLRAASEEQKALFAQSYQDALVAFHRKDWRAAEAAIEKARRIDPGDPHGWVLTARILLKKKEYEGARAALREALRRQPDFGPALRVSGDLAFDQRRFGDGFRLYNEALLREPGDKNIILKMLYCQVMMGDLGAAERFLARLSPFDEANPAYYFGKAAIFHVRGKHQEGDLLQTARVMYGNDVFADYLADYEFLFVDHRESS